MDINRVINNNLDINNLGINSLDINKLLMGLRLHTSNRIMVKEINKDTINKLS